MIKNVDIKFSAHDAFLESPLSGTLKVERWEIFKTRGPKQDSQNQLRSSMSEGENPYF